MNAVGREVDRLLAAFQFFTRLPVAPRPGHEAEALHDAIRYFPMVGVCIGALGAGALLGARTVWPMMVAVAISMLLTVVVTGAFHEDGLADAADGLGASVGRDQALEIMKDSRIGAFGAVALVLALLLKFATLTALPLRSAALALVGGHTVSRLGAVLIMATLPYVRVGADSRSQPIAHGVSKQSLTVAGFTTAAAVWPLHFGGAAGGAAAIGVCVVWRGYLKRRLGGWTGDCLGAAQQAAECGFYLACAALA